MKKSRLLQHLREYAGRYKAKRYSKFFASCFRFMSQKLCPGSGVFVFYEFPLTFITLLAIRLVRSAAIIISGMP